MRGLMLALVVGVAAVVFTGTGAGNQPETVEAAAAESSLQDEEPDSILSPIWAPSISRWSSEIGTVARSYGIDPDFIASVINAESNGDPTGVSRVGAVGLMGVMPSGPGLEWRPTPDELTDPTVNLTWGGAILADILRQSGGDINAALAAYSGGWAHATSQVPQDYTARVLNDYGRAVVTRIGVAPNMALQWTVAVEITRGNIPPEPLLFGRQPLSGLRLFGLHMVYEHVDRNGRGYHVRGYAVPLILIAPAEPDAVSFGGSDTLEAPLMERLGLAEHKAPRHDLRLLQACLPSLNRLRGYLSTRWFAPVYCPDRQR